MDAIFHVKGVCQAHLAVKRPLHVVFVDFKKAFDSVLHSKLTSILRELNTPEDVVRLIEDLYSKAHGTITWKGEKTAPFNTPVGVRQGCPISPALFNLYTEHLMREWTVETAHLTSPDVEGVQCTEQRYADDLVLMALTAEDVQEMLATLGVVAERYGLHIHPEKTEYMVIKSTMDDATISYSGNMLKRVSRFKYLGTTITHDLDDAMEIRCRIAIAKETLNRCTYLKSTRINITTKLHLIKALVASRLTYGCCTWRVKTAEAKRLDAFGREIWRRHLGLSWQDMVSNKELERRIGGRWTFSTDVTQCMREKQAGAVMQCEVVVCQLL